MEQQIGYLSACIAGDHRYTSTMVVYADPDTSTVTVEVKKTGAVGGMDGPGGSYDSGVSFSMQLMRPSPRVLIDMIWRAINSDVTLKNYGIPSKRFTWGRHHRDAVTGLSQAKAKAALKVAFGRA
jgi:hypothetical protein